MPQPISTSGIVASAFEFIELRPISSFADDSEEAQSAARHYALALGASLEVMDWSFASTVAHLPLAAGSFAADDDLPYAYARPADLVRLRRIYPHYAKWRLDEGVLRADEPAPLKIRYTRLVEDESKFPATFHTLVALHLAVRLSRRWAKSTTQKRELIADLNDAMDAAAMAERNSASPERYDDLDYDPPDWVSEAIA